MAQSTVQLLGNMPPELVSEIFSFCVSGCLPSFQQPHSNKAVNLTMASELASVCRTWRHVAHSDPRLWADIVLNSSNNSSESINTQIARMDSIMSRSGSSHPLTIRIHSPWTHSSTYIDPAADPESIAVSSFIRKYASRWKSIKTSIALDYAVAFPAGPDTLPLLQTLHLECNSRFHASPLNLAVVAPQLTTFTISRTKGHEFDFVQVHLSWGNLRTITLNSVSLSECLAISSLTSSSLVHLRLGNVRASEDSESDVEEDAASLRALRMLGGANTIIMSALHTLDISPQAQGPALGHFVRSLCLPSLQRLRYNGTINQGTSGTSTAITLSEIRALFSSQVESGFPCRAPRLIILRRDHHHGAYGMLDPDHNALEDLAAAGGVNVVLLKSQRNCVEVPWYTEPPLWEDMTNDWRPWSDSDYWVKDVERTWRA